MSWNNDCMDKPNFKTIDELRNKVKLGNECNTANNSNNSASDTEPEMVPEAVKKKRIGTKKNKKQQEPAAENFVKELDLYDLEALSESESKKACGGNKPQGTNLVDIRLAITTINKDLKKIIRRIAAVNTVIADISLTDIPKNVSQTTKEVEKLTELLYSMDINIPSKQNKKKGK